MGKLLGEQAGDGEPRGPIRGVFLSVPDLPPDDDGQSDIQGRHEVMVARLNARGIAVDDVLVDPRAIVLSPRKVQEKAIRFLETFIGMKRDLIQMAEGDATLRAGLRAHVSEKIWSKLVQYLETPDCSVGQKIMLTDWHEKVVKLFDRFLSGEITELAFDVQLSEVIR